MGRGASIEASEVWSAAEAVLQQGLQPSAERVRHRLGRASRDGIGPHLDSWYAQLAARLGPARELGPGTTVPSTVLEAAAGLWRAASAAADERLRGRIDELEAALDQGQQQLISADQAHREEREATARERAEAELALAAELRAARDAAAQALADRDAARQEMADGDDDLERRLVEQAGEFDRERRALHEQLAANEQRYAADVDRARDEAGQLYLKLVAVEQERNDYAALSTTLAAGEEAQRSALADAVAQAAQAVESERRAQESAAQLIARLTDAENEAAVTITMLSERLDTLRGENHALGEKLAAHLARVEDQDLAARLAGVQRGAEERAPDGVQSTIAAGAARETQAAASTELERVQAELDEVRGELWAKAAQCRTLMRSLAAHGGAMPPSGVVHRNDKVRKPAPRIPSE